MCCCLSQVYWDIIDITKIHPSHCAVLSVDTCVQLHNHHSRHTECSHRHPVAPQNSLCGRPFPVASPRQPASAFCRWRSIWAGVSAVWSEGHLQQSRLGPIYNADSRAPFQALNRSLGEGGATTCILGGPAHGSCGHVNVKRHRGRVCPSPRGCGSI